MIEVNYCLEAMDFADMAALRRRLTRIIPILFLQLLDLAVRWRALAPGPTGLSLHWRPVCPCWSWAFCCCAADLCLGGCIPACARHIRP